MIRHGLRNLLQENPRVVNEDHLGVVQLKKLRVQSLDKQPHLNVW
jgi:hypothetical protein